MHPAKSKSVKLLNVLGYHQLARDIKTGRQTVRESLAFLRACRRFHMLDSQERAILNKAYDVAVDQGI